ncbi:hypothetical protein [Massilia glaciei]|uniref:hypothetical protein n=1 Tax=Massilia glaciei TaxID=1524097 RepID=UPI0011B29A07|nr:hypothetical protein [Massilia glaciei]
MFSLLSRSLGAVSLSKGKSIGRVCVQLLHKGVKWFKTFRSKNIQHQTPGACRIFGAACAKRHHSCQVQLGACMAPSGGVFEIGVSQGRIPASLRQLIPCLLVQLPGLGMFDFRIHSSPLGQAQRLPLLVAKPAHNWKRM